MTAPLGLAPEKVSVSLIVIAWLVPAGSLAAGEKLIVPKLAVGAAVMVKVPLVPLAAP